MERAHDFSHGEEEHPYIHPELQAVTPDQRDVGVNHWFHRKNRLSEYDPAELEAVAQELHDIPEVERYSRERVKLETILALPTTAADYVASEHEQKFQERLTGFQELLDELPTYLERYTDSVRRFHGTQTQRFHLEPEKFRLAVKRVDQGRRSSHDALMSHLKAISRFMLIQVPKLGGSDFNGLGWEKFVQQHWFTIDELNDRETITDWAVRVDIAQKARELEDAIHDVLEQKKSAAE